MYQDTTQFGFANSQIGAMPSTLDQVNPAYYPQIEQFIRQKGGRLASICGIRLYYLFHDTAGAQP